MTRRTTVITALTLIAVAAAVVFTATRGDRNMSMPEEVDDVGEVDESDDANAGDVDDADDIHDADDADEDAGAAAALAAARAFLDRYVADDGRVVRHDQGGDTVSEGQAYALLLAVAVEDERMFRTVWDWTRANLVGPDGLLAAHWNDGGVVDDDAATDADLDAAHALVLAGDRFGEPAFSAAAVELASAIAAHEIQRVGDRHLLLPGPWARGAEPVVFNPSYVSPLAFDALGAASGDPIWDALRADSFELLDHLMAPPAALPPDWAEATADVVTAAPVPGDDGPPRYGYEAVRVPIRLAADRDGPGSDLAARLWPFLEQRVRQGLVDVYALDGSPLGEAPHPVALVAAAAAARAAGDDGAVHDVLDAAAALDEERPSYYGAAWVALGRVLLTTDLLDPH
ncbi:MAG: glycoside hydrolase [Actinobacteria bacterium]|nr:glycoside hydrolase [Actinomycetota bacterium]